MSYSQALSKGTFQSRFQALPRELKDKIFICLAKSCLEPGIVFTDSRRGLLSRADYELHPSAKYHTRPNVAFMLALNRQSLGHARRMLYSRNTWVLPNDIVSPTVIPRVPRIAIELSLIKSIQLEFTLRDIIGFAARAESYERCSLCLEHRLLTWIDGECQTGEPCQEYLEWREKARSECFYRFEIIWNVLRVEHFTAVIREAFIWKHLRLETPCSNLWDIVPIDGIKVVSSRTEPGKEGVVSSRMETGKEGVEKWLTIEKRSCQFCRELSHDPALDFLRLVTGPV